MLNTDLIDLITHGREERNLEYKKSMNWKNNETKAKVIKSCLGMANIRDGGFIIFGVDQEGEEFVPHGMKEEDFNSFSQDQVSAVVNEYADPFVEIAVLKENYNNMNFIVIQIEEFFEAPIVCKKDGSHGLARGAVYTRTRRMYETAKVPSQSEMREILEMAAEKGIRNLQSKVSRAGLVLRESDEEDRKKFDEELNGL
jgi:predicted HTH transcriptional regulator